MTRRVCLMACANDFLPTLLAQLPHGVGVVDWKEMFDIAARQLKLVGPGLPDWCEEPKNGGPYVWAAAIIGGDGIMRICPAQPIPQPDPQPTFYERIIESNKHLN